MHIAKTLTHRARFFLPLLAILVLGGAFFASRTLVPVAHSATASTTVAAHAATAQTPQSAASLAAALQQAGLPVAQVALKEVPNAKGTVIYIPQIHLAPGSDPASSANDTAAATQKQIQQIVDYVTKNEGVSQVMVEGSLYGPVSSSTIAVATQKMQARDALTAAANQLAQSCTADTCAQTAAEARSLANQLDREVALSGGALVSKASGGTFALIGAEDPAVQDQAGSIVRNWYYIGDRITQLTGKSPDTAGLQQGAIGTAYVGPGSTSVSAAPAAPALDDSGVAKLKLYALLNGNSAVTNSANVLADALSQAKNAESAGAALTAHAAQNLPSRSDNPYKSDTDVTDLQSKLAQTQNDMQNTIVDTRNKMASTHIAEQLKNADAQTGVLVYGAGHTAGLIQQLQSRGLSVLVVVPAELGGDAEISSALASS